MCIDGELFLRLTHALNVRIGEGLGVRFEDGPANEGGTEGGARDT